MAKRMDRHGRVSVLHYVTFNVRDRVKAFRDDAYARAAALELRAHCDAHPAKLVAYVVMPEHMHAILNPRDGDIDRFLSQFKPAVSLQVAALAQAQHRIQILDWMCGSDGRYHLWQQGKHNLHLWSERLIWQKINYIHTNPIVRRLVQTADAYPYSSFRAMYAPEMEVIIPIDIPFWWEEKAITLWDEGG